MKTKFRELFCTTLFLIITIFLLSQTASAVTINVPSQYATIQAAIDTASSGDVVLVSPGTYVENIDFKGKNITVGSLFLTTGISSYIDSTIIDGNANGNPVVRFYSGETRDAILTGFTIQNGYTTTNEWGAGIDIQGSSTQPTLRNLVIKNNNAQSGRGGGIRLYYTAIPLVEKVKILNNTCSDMGGGIYAYASNLDLNEVVIAGNSAVAGSAIYFIAGGTLTIKNSLIYNNPSVGQGAVVLWSYAHYIYNTTIANNDGGTCKTGIWAGGINTYLNNTIVSDHADYNIVIAADAGSIFSVDYSLIQNGSGSINNIGAPNILQWNAGNLTTDPLFVDPANGDYHLQTGSPCIDSGTSVNAPSTDLDGLSRPQGAGYDMGAYERSSDCYPPVKVNSIYFNTVQDACDYVSDGNAVLLQTGTFIENVLFNRDISTVLQGGYDCPYDANPGYTTIDGSLTISNGSVTVDKVIIRGQVIPE